MAVTKTEIIVKKEKTVEYLKIEEMSHTSPELIVEDKNRTSGAPASEIVQISVMRASVQNGIVIFIVKNAKGKFNSYFTHESSPARFNIACF